MAIFFLILLLFSTTIWLYLYSQKLSQKTGYLKEAVEDLKLLQEVSKEITSKLKISELLPAIMDAFVKAGQVKKGSIMLFDKKKDVLKIKAARGVSKRAIENIELHAGEGVAGRVVQTGQSVLINDTTTAGLYKDFFEQPEKSRPRETLLCLPLIFKDEVLGVVTLDSKLSGEQFIRNDERLLSILASQAAVAINNARMYKMAITDPLTDLYVSRFFLTRLEQEIEKAKRYKGKFSLLFLDIDHFKKFNDRYGHQMGDKALIHLANIMEKTTRSADICGRYGGEEFVILLPETPKNKAAVLARRLRKKVSESGFRVKGKRYKITVSIGVAEYTPGVDKVQKIIKKADKKLYMAKKQGRNRVVS